MKEELALFVRLNGFISGTKVISASHRRRRHRRGHRKLRHLCRHRHFQVIACRGWPQSTAPSPAPRTNRFINILKRYAVGLPSTYI